MIAKKIWSVLAVVLALGLGVGCELDISPGNNDGVYSYNVDEIAAGLFGAMSPTMTMNEWCLKVTYPRRSYDELVQEGLVVYKDENMETPYAGSDTIDEDTVIYCDFSFNGQDKKIGDITGTITLTNIPHPATKVYIHNSGPYQWLIGKVNMSEADLGGTLDWSIPLYEKYFFPGFQTGLTLSVLPGDSLNAYAVSLPTQITINDANTDVGDLGVVSIKGVTLSGTINVTYNGLPVPYVEIYALYGPASAPLGITYLFSPGPNAPWSITFGPDANLYKKMDFKVYGCSKKDWTVDDMLFDKPLVNLDVYVVNNESVSGIVLDLGEVGGD